MSNIDLRLKSLDLAVSIYGTLPINDLISHASEIEKYLSAQTIEIKPTISFLNFINQLTIADPFRGLIPFKPYEYQGYMANALQDATRLALLMPRQMGTTWIISAYAVWKCLMNPGISITLAAPRFNQVANNKNYIDTIIQLLPKTFDNTCKINNKTKIIFNNSASIQFLSLTSEFNNDLTANALIIDNASFVPDVTGRQILPLLSNKLIEQIIVAGNPMRAVGFLYDIANNSGFSQFSAKWNEHPHRDNAWKQKMEATIGPDSFKREYEPRFA